jgi:tetratricopeptide (TPR) repeat protein
VRILYQQELVRNPFHDQPIIDAAEYYGWAKMIASGEWLWQRVHIHGPAYPYLLAGLMRLGGSFDVFYFVQHLLGIAILYLVYDVGRILWGAPVGLTALAFAMLYARFLFLEGLLLAETLAAFLDLVALRLAIGLGLRRARPLAWGAVGLAIGLSAITRPTILAVAPALIYWSYRAGAPIAAPRRVAALLGGIAILIAPVFLRNVSIGDPVLLQANGGMNFYIGNRAGSDGLASVPPGTEWNAIERLADRAGMVRETDRDSFYYRRALAEMAGEPLRALSRAAKRFLLFWGGWEVEISQDFTFFRERSVALRMLFLPAAIIAPLALCGVLLTARSARSRAPQLLPLLFLLSYLAAVLPFPYATRYRMPIFPVHVLFAAFAFVHFARAVRSRSLAGREWGALAAAFLVLNFTPLSLPEKGIVRTHLHLGKMLYDRGDARGALAEYERALERDPEGADVWNNIGLAREELGDREGALGAYRRALRSAPDHGKARANVAGIFYQRGEIDSSLAEMRKAVEAEPRNPEFLNNLGALLSRTGAVGEAIATLEKGAALGPDNDEVLYNLAQVYEKANRPEDAERVFRFLASKRETKEIRVRLGALAERTGRPEAAYAEYRRALEIDPAYPEGLRSLGVFLLRAGRRTEALPLLTKYLSARPSDTEIRNLLEQTGP